MISLKSQTRRTLKWKKNSHKSFLDCCFRRVEGNFFFFKKIEVTFCPKTFLFLVSCACVSLAASFAFAFACLHTFCLAAAAAIPSNERDFFEQDRNTSFVLFFFSSSPSSSSSLLFFKKTIERKKSHPNSFLIALFRVRGVTP